MWGRRAAVVEQPDHHCGDDLGLNVGGTAKGMGWCLLHYYHESLLLMRTLNFQFAGFVPPVFGSLSTTSTTMQQILTVAFL